MGIKMSKLSLYLDGIASNKISLDWDNTGLLIGDPQGEVKRILLAIDVTRKVVDYAIKHGFDTIISHHPLFIKPLKQINDPIFIKLLQNNIKVYSMHTNLDQIEGGVSWALGEKLGLEDLHFIDNTKSEEGYRVTIRTSKEDSTFLVDLITLIHDDLEWYNYGRYARSEVSVKYVVNHSKFDRTKMEGVTRPKEELKLELTVNAENITKIKAFLQKHAEETSIKYEITSFQQEKTSYDLGVIGQLPKRMTLDRFALHVKKSLGVKFVKVWAANKSMKTSISQVAVCGGNGSDLAPRLKGLADVFVSSDFTYHKIIESSLPLIDAGHFHTEYPVLERLKNLLSELPIEVEVYDKKLAEINGLRIL